jgi:hypothetical protein
MPSVATLSVRFKNGDTDSCHLTEELATDLNDFVLKLLDELGGRDDATRTSDEMGEDHAFLRPGDRQRLPPVVGNLERSKDEEPHGPKASPLARGE